MILKLFRHRSFVIFSCGAKCSILLLLNCCQKEISVSSTENLKFSFFFFFYIRLRSFHYFNGRRCVIREISAFVYFYCTSMKQGYYLWLLSHLGMREWMFLMCHSATLTVVKRHQIKVYKEVT